MEKIKLVVGDWSNDGHGDTKEYHVEVNCNPSNIKDYYTVGSQALGFDLKENVCEDYEDNCIESNVLRTLMDFGFSGLSNIDKDDLHEGATFEIDTDEFVDIYMFVVQTGYHITHEDKLPVFEWKKVDNSLPTFNIGGYGLFMSW